MAESTNALAAWESFYVIVGSSGGALIGLQFVVVTLLAEKRRLAGSGGLNAFATPTVVHFSGALVIAAIMSAPWGSAAALSFTMGAVGLSGMAYGVIVLMRTLRQKVYKPVWEDWLWYTALPGICYAGLAIAASLNAMARSSLFIIAAAALGLLLIGIHNAWDTVTHIVLTDSAATDVGTDAAKDETPREVPVETATPETSPGPVTGLLVPPGAGGSDRPEP